MTGPAPPIPAWLAHRPISGGLVVPWITPATIDGRHVFGGIDEHRVQRALCERLCGVCGRRLDHPMVLLMRLSDLPIQGTVEPALHPVCTAYTVAACPMVSGHMTHHRATPPRLDESMTPVTDTAARLSAPAEPWFSVWLSHYRLTNIHGHLAASYRGIRPLRTRPITWRLPALPT